MCVCVIKRHIVCDNYAHRHAGQEWAKHLFIMKHFLKINQSATCDQHKFHNIPLHTFVRSAKFPCSLSLSLTLARYVVINLILLLNCFVVCCRWKNTKQGKQKNEWSMQTLNECCLYICTYISVSKLKRKIANKISTQKGRNEMKLIKIPEHTLMYKLLAKCIFNKRDIKWWFH